VVSGVDLSRYIGWWYEIARLPNGFQRTGENSMAEYELAADGIAVRNFAVTREGKSRFASGSAMPIPGSGNARFRVRFGGLASLFPVSKEGNYWIIDLDRENYQYALVGTPDRKFLWILSRTPELPERAREILLTTACRYGFDTDKLIWDRWDECLERVPELLLG